MKHLWEVDHSYYCENVNYFSGGCCVSYDSWGEFERSGEVTANLNMNLVFRWDWTSADPREDRLHDELSIFFVGQRKGLFRSAVIKVTQEDEDKVKDYLLPRMRHLFSLWQPLLEVDEVGRARI